MVKIYLDYCAGSHFTFPLVKGPEPEGKFLFDQEGLCCGAGRLERLALCWCGGETYPVFNMELQSLGSSFKTSCTS